VDVWARTAAARPASNAIFWLSMQKAFIWFIYEI
jgi:hypothetical protein